ncbi:MAG: putative TIM-barrel fold metal-dependent hydrolase, partial [Betaproteobacteria bacterium]|nr:putative TIM-barrel fold metal-dependent hydrolase [Betaproteobacteria bacterium]
YFAVPEEEIKRLESVLTIVGGKPVYGAAEFKDLSPPPLPIVPEWSPVAHYGGYRNSAAASTPAAVVAQSTRAHSHFAEHVWGPGACPCWAF